MSDLEKHGHQHRIGGPDPIGLSGNAIYAIKVWDDNSTVVVGDGAFEWEIPEDLDGSVLVKIEAFVTTVSSSGTVQIQIANERAAGGTVDMLSTLLSIDPNELNSKDAAVPVVINAANDDVAWGDHLRIDIDNAGTGAKGLGLICYFQPAATVAFVIEGAKGDPGGITSWDGGWESTTTYTVGQAVSNGGSSYVAIQGSTDVEPGVDAGWEDYWMLLAGGQQISALGFAIDGNGTVLDPGIKTTISVPFACTITSVVMLADQVGSAVVDIWKDTFANYPPTNADSITAASPPTLSSTDHSEDTVLSGWTTALLAGDALRFNIDSCSTITQLTVFLKVTRS